MTNKHRHVFVRLKIFTRFFCMAMLFACSHANATDTSQSISNMETESTQADNLKKNLDLSFRTRRVEAQRTLDNLVMLFPEHVKNSAVCYQAALSNYVEDQWKRIAKEHGCVSDDKVCKKDPEKIRERYKTFFDAAKDNFHKKIVVELVNMSIVVSDFESFSRPIIFTLMPDHAIYALVEDYKAAPPNIKNVSPDVARTDELKKYVTSCASSKPQPWSVVGTDPPLSPSLDSTSAKLSIYNILMLNLIGSELPHDKQDLVGCLMVLDSLKTAFKGCRDDIKCIDAIAVDTKDDLKRQLDDFRAHQCRRIYGINLVQPSPQPPPTTDPTQK